MLLSFDISTSVIGVSAFDNNGKLLKMNCVKFKKDYTLFEKLEQFEKEIADFKHVEVTKIIIEEPLKKFKGKFSSATTIATLNFFNGMISSYLYTNFKIEPIYYNVITARSLVFPGVKLGADGAKVKHNVWRGVMELEPQINWRYSKTGKLADENYDMADSYVVGLAYFMDIIKKEEILIKEAEKAERSAVKITKAKTPKVISGTTN